jgi:putative transposase
LNNAAIFEQKLNYIYENPVQSGFVESAIDYPYSSARDYAGEKGLVNVILLRIDIAIVEGISRS